MYTWNVQWEIFSIFQKDILNIWKFVTRVDVIYNPNCENTYPFQKNVKMVLYYCHMWVVSKLMSALYGVGTFTIICYVCGVLSMLANCFEIKKNCSHF